MSESDRDVAEPRVRPVTAHPPLLGIRRQEDTSDDEERGPRGVHTPARSVIAGSHTRRALNLTRPRGGDETSAQS